MTLNLPKSRTSVKVIKKERFPPGQKSQKVKMVKIFSYSVELNFSFRIYYWSGDLLRVIESKQQFLGR